MAQLRDMIRTNQPSGALAYADFKDLKLDSEGNFDVILSAERPANYTGDWWKLEPDTENLMVRQVSSDWGQEVDLTLYIVQLDTPPATLPLSAADTLARRAESLTILANASRFFVHTMFVGA